MYPDCISIIILILSKFGHAKIYKWKFTFCQAYVHILIWKEPNLFLGTMFSHKTSLGNPPTIHFFFWRHHSVKTDSLFWYEYKTSLLWKDSIKKLILSSFNFIFLYPKFILIFPNFLYMDFILIKLGLLDMDRP